MISTSPEFQTAVNSDFRRSEAAVMIHFAGKKFTPTATATSQFDSSTSPSQAAVGRIRPNDFASTGLGTSYNNMHKGWWSQAVTNESKTFTTPQELIIDYGESISLKNFWFVADRVYYPLDFDIQYTNNTTWTTLTTVTGNDNHIWSFINSSAVTFNKIKLIVRKAAIANQNVRVLHFGAVTTVLFEKDDIVDFKLLEETKAETNNPIGVITANEFSMTISNEYKWYTIDNESSPFYDLIKPKILVEPYIGIETSTDNFEFVSLGKFKVSDWDAPSSTIESNLIAYDKLYEIIDKDVPMKLPMRDGTTLKDLFIYLFDSLGIPSAEYQIDDSISFPVHYGWLPKGKAGPAFQMLSEAGNCSVFVNRQDIIRVKDNRQSGASIASINDDNQIISINNPQKFMNAFSTVKVDYSVYYLSETKQIARLDKITVPPGIREYKDITFSSADPVGNVAYINLIGSKNIKVEQIVMGTWTMDLKLNNTGTADEVISVEIRGKTIDSNTVQKQAVDNNALLKWGEKTFTLNSPYIQDEVVAQNYCNSLIKFSSDPKAFYSLNVRSNPSFELLDLIDVQSNTDNIGLTQLSIIRNEIIFNGGLEGNIDARKVIS